MSSIGDMPMPCDFPYAKIAAQGKPQHAKHDAFRLRHPSMDVGKRAKIFAPFDALKGFNEAVSAKDELYVNKKDLSDDDQAEVNRRLTILNDLTLNSRLARDNALQIAVTFYTPCTDPENEAFEIRGQYRTITGLCRKVDPDVRGALLIDKTWISFRNIALITGPPGLF